MIGPIMRDGLSVYPPSLILEGPFFRKAHGFLFSAMVK